jgi:glycosyltransferase involved in cell wall biosynthesis
MAYYQPEVPVIKKLKGMDMMDSAVSCCGYPAVAVIIPTTCERHRWNSLTRAIQSIQGQACVDVSVIVVVNGQRFDPIQYEKLMEMTDLTVVYQHEGSLPMAMQYGRSLVTTAFFAFLDDDDEYLPEALFHRLQPLLSDDVVDYVASNGFRSMQGLDQLAVLDVTAVRTNPLLALSKENWLASCGGLFRSSSVSLQYFDGRTADLEWTYLAYKLASALTMSFVNVPTFRIYDSDASLSKAPGYQEAVMLVLPEILRLDLPAQIRHSVRAKIGRTYHNMAHYSHEQGNIAKAWRYHLASLCYPGGWHYILYSRKLFFSLKQKIEKVSS